MSPALEPGALDFFSHSEEQTRRLGAKLGRLAQAGQVIALLGDLGTGKTRLAQGFGAGLGVPPDEVINSPTFTLIIPQPLPLHSSPHSPRTQERRVGKKWR